MSKIASAKKYSKPSVLAVSKKGNRFSAGCQTRSGAMCISCRCS